MTGKKFKLHIAGKTDTGMLREHNEDFIGFDEDAALAVLADGLGGRASGEVASCMAVTSILTELRPDRPLQAEAGDLFGELLEAIDAANRRIYYAANANKCHNGMSTTLVASIALQKIQCFRFVGRDRRTDETVLADLELDVALVLAIPPEDAHLFRFTNPHFREVTVIRDNVCYRRSKGSSAHDGDFSNPIGSFGHVWFLLQPARTHLRPSRSRTEDVS